MKNSRQILSLFALVSLVGAGCDPTRMLGGSSVPTPKTEAQIAATQGFGKLPKLSGSSSAVGNYGTASMMRGSSAATPMMAPSAAPSLAADMMAVGSPGKVMMLPPPSPRPVSVEYTIAATLPTWGTSGDVLQTVQEMPDAAAARSLAKSSGVPNAALRDDASISSVNLQWKDADGLQWSLDAQNRMLSFWKEATAQPSENPQNAPPKFDSAEITKIADAFLDAHGFLSIRQTGGEIDEQQYRIMMDAANSTGEAMMPCPMMRGEAAPAIYPSPCGWWQQQVTIFYASKREGRPIVDVSGWPNRTNSITVDVRTKQVTNGSLQLDQTSLRSSYPLVDMETAKKRLQSGGLNPVWPWGSETKSVKVTLKTIELAWLRYDVWNGTTQDTYFLPALAVTGTVDRGVKGQQPEDYRTVVPLVMDSAFDETPFPEPVPLPAVIEAAPAVIRK